MKTAHSARPRRPLAASLSKFRTLLGMTAALGFATQSEVLAAPLVWEGTFGGTPGDGILWNDPLNWEGDLVPLGTDDLTFGLGTVGTVQLGGNQSVNTLTFGDNFTLGSYGDRNTLSNVTGNITVPTGVFGTINSDYTGPTLNLIGGGGLFLGGFTNNFNGAIFIEGPGTQLTVRSHGVLPYINNVGHVIVGRSDNQSLGQAPAKVITLQNQGEIRIVGNGYNPDGTTKSFLLSSGGGVLNMPAAWQQLSIDDGNQISGAGALIKVGDGRMVISGANDYNIGGVGATHVLAGGVLQFTRLAGGVNTAGTRFGAFAPGSEMVVSSGILAPNGRNSANNGDVVGTVDWNITLDGGALGVQALDHQYGATAGAASSITLSSGSILLRDTFNVQQHRLPRFQAQLLGSGTVDLVPSTNVGGNSRMVLQRSDVGSSFDGTFRLLGNAVLEQNPRFSANVGKTLANAKVEMRGFAPIFDIRDDGPGANQLLNSGISDYTTNQVILSGDQGALPVITVNRNSTTASVVGNIFVLGALELGDHRLRIDGANTYGLAFNVASIKGDGILDLNTAPLSLLGAGIGASVIEDEAGRTLTRVGRQAAAQDLVIGAPVIVTNVNVAFGPMQMRGSGGIIDLGLAGESNITVNGGGGQNPAAGQLHLDNAGSTIAVSAGNNTDRVPDTATVTLLGNSIIRLTSSPSAASFETLGADVTVGGHTLFDVIKTGVASSPVHLTLGTTSFTLGPGATANYVGTTLGAAGGDSTRIVIPGQADVAFMGAAHHSGAEWTRYSNVVDNGVPLGVIPWTNADYTDGVTSGVGLAEALWTKDIPVKLTAGAGPLTGNRAVHTLNLQLAAAGAGVTIGANTLTVDRGGIIAASQNTGIVGDGNLSTITAGDGTAPAALTVYSNSQLDLNARIADNGAQPVTLIKSGTGTMRLTHHSYPVNSGTLAAAPFTAATYTGAFTGGVIINDGTLAVHRGQFLNGQTITFNGGAVEVTHPVPTSNANSILPGWGNDVVVNGNSFLGFDDNGESADAQVGGNTLVPLGSLTINGGHTLGIAAWNNDAIFTEGATFSGRPTLNVGASRGNSVNHTFTIGGAATGSGFEVLTYGSASQTLILGGGSSDAAANDFSSNIVLRANVLRLNKANGTTALNDTADGVDLIINGGTLAWGPGHHGDFTTTNNPALTNNNQIGLANLSPVSARAAGMNQIADTATITLMTGFIGETDRIQNEVFGTLNMLNGTLNAGNAGEGTLEIGTGNIEGGAIAFNWGTHLKFGTLNLKPGAPVLTLNNGFLARPTVLEVGAGGVAFNGTRVELSSGGLSNFVGGSSILRLGGNVTSSFDPLNGNSGSQQGIFTAVGGNMREISKSYIDLMGGTRDFNIEDGVLFGVSSLMRNGGFTKSGAGVMVIQHYIESTMAGGLFEGPVGVNEGMLIIRNSSALGTSAGGVTVASGGTLKVDGSVRISDALSLNGPGANVSGTTDIKELGALVLDQGQLEISGPATLAGNSTIAASGTTITGVAAAPIIRSAISVSSAGGITGTGTLTLTGMGDGSIANGINTTAGGLIKEGAGTWEISGGGSYVGATSVNVGVLRVAHANALGSAAEGTTVHGGASLQLTGGVSIAEPITVHGAGILGRTGAIDNAGGNNTISGQVTLGTDATIASSSGTVTFTAPLSIFGSNRSLVLTGAGNGVIDGAVTLSSPASTVAITKNGSGTWSLRGATGFTGRTDVNGGTLVLDHSGINLAKLDPASGLTLGGGNIELVGSAIASAAESVISTTVFAGGNRVSVTSGAGQSATLNMGNIDRVPASGSTVDFELPSNGEISTSTITSFDLLGAYATVGGTDWATTSGTSVSRFTAYENLVSAGLDFNNSRSTKGMSLTGSVITNSLKIEDAPGVATGSGSLALVSGGLLKTGAGLAGISGTGLVAGELDSAELFIHVAGGTLDITNPLIGGSGGLTKAGNGALILRGASSFTGPIHVNGGSLGITGPGGTTHPTTLGSAAGPRTFRLDGGTFSVFQGNFDPGVNTMQFVIGPDGGTFQIRDSNATGSFLLNDAGQFSGVGDLRITGGGRMALGGAAGYSAFTGNVHVEQGALRLDSLGAMGGRKEQVIRLGAGTALVSNAGGSGNTIGLPNDIVAEGAQITSQGGDRTLTGDIRFSGNNAVVLVERDAVQQARSLTMAGRLSGTGTLDIYGGNQGSAVGGQGNGSFLFVSSSSNTFAGTINLRTNGGLEVRQPGALGTTPGQVTVNMDTNSRFLLRGPASGDFHPNVVINGDSVISAARMSAGAAFGSGDRTQLSINNLTVNNGNVLSMVSGSDNYTIRVNGTATFNGNANIIAGSNNLALMNGATFTTPDADFNKDGTLGVFLFDTSNHSGITSIRNGAIFLRGANGSLPATTAIELRGPNAQLYVDNGDAANPDRINDSATIILGGGAFRVNGTETAIGPVQAPGGHNIVSYSLASLTTSTPFQLGSTFTRVPGATFSFTTENGTLGATNGNAFRAQPRITVPGLADVPSGDIIPWAVGTNNEFVRYDGTTIEGGAPLGVIQVGNNVGGNYLNEPNDAQLISGNIIRLTGTNATTTFAGSRTVRAIKMDGGDPALNATARRIDLATNTLTVDRGLIIHVNQTQNIGNSNTAAPGSVTSGNGELIVVANAGTLEFGPGSYTAADSTTTSGTATALTGQVIITNNPGPDLMLGNGDDIPVAFVKSGGGTVEFRNPNLGNTFTGGVFVNQGTLRTYRGAGLGPVSNTITLNGGSLEIHSDESAATANDNIFGLGHNVVVNGNALLGADNGVSAAAANVDDNLNMGSLTINGGYTFQVGGFDGFDFSFTSADFTGTPTIDIGLGRTSATADLSTTTINGPITGSGFRVIAGNVTANSIGTLQLAGNTSNTYSGDVTVYDGTVQLNKGAAALAITGDLTINGGAVNWLQANQMVSTGKLTLNRGNVNFGGFAQTLSGIDMNGGFIVTGANILNVTGDVNLRGTNNADGLQINSGATVTIDGKLSIRDFGKAILGGSGTVVTRLTVGGLEMEGTPLRMNADAGTAGNELVLLGDVKTFPSVNPAGIGNVDGAADDAQTFINLNGARTFDVADGTAGVDLLVRGVLRDNGATAGSLIKVSPGLMILEGGGNPNTYSGVTSVNAGILELSKSAGTNAIPGDLFIGDGVGGARADRVQLRNSDQIANGSNVTISASGVLDLATFARSETVASISGSGDVDLGTGGTLTVSGPADATYSGSIRGGGGVTKGGAGVWTLLGASAYVGDTVITGGTLSVIGSITGGTVRVNDGTVLSGTGSVSDVVVTGTGLVTPGPGIATLNTGSFDLSSGALSLELDSSTSYDKINVTGTITLAGSLSLSLGAGVFNTGDVLSLMINDGVDPVLGTFAGLPEGAVAATNGGIDYLISYTGNVDGGAVANDVVLIVPEPGSAALLLGGLGSLLAVRRRRRA